jgi:hypothetical protein
MLSRENMEGRYVTAASMRTNFSFGADDSFAIPALIDDAITEKYTSCTEVKLEMLKVLRLT